MSKYDDILYHSRPSSTHPKMSCRDRAAQFAPFAALTGYENAIQETGRLTDDRKEWTEDTLEQLNQKIAYIFDKIHEKPLITLTLFIPDAIKKGGAYQKKEVRLIKYDEARQAIVCENDERIPMEQIVDVFWTKFPEYLL